MKPANLGTAITMALIGAAALPPTVSGVYACDTVIEEVLVTAWRREETLQDVPVTVAALTEQDLDRYNISTLTEASKLEPDFSIFHGGSGNGSNIILRGIGSSSISAALDQSVAINIGRFIHNTYMDMGQIEVLKGPQSLYFEGVISSPITDTLGVRVSFDRTKSDELFKNLTPGVEHPFRGEDATNARVTLVWQPNDVLSRD